MKQTHLWFYGFLAAVALSVGWPQTACAQRGPDYPTVGHLIDGHSGHLWVVQIQQDNRFGLLHRLSGEHPNTEQGAEPLFYVIRSTPGIPVATAAYDQWLYVVFDNTDNLTVQSFERIRPQPPLPGRVENQLMPPIAKLIEPGTARKLVAFGAGEKGPLALVQDGDPTANDGTAPPTRYRLLRVEANAWKPVQLPESLTAPRRLVGMDGHRLFILEAPGNEQVVSHEWNGQKWLRHNNYEGLRWSPSMQAVSVKQGLAVARVSPDSPNELEAVALRPTEHYSLGKLGTLEEGHQWQVVSNNHRIDLVVVGPDHQLKIGGRDTQLEPKNTPDQFVPLEPKARPPADVIDPMLMVVIGSTFVIMLVVLSIRRPVPPTPPVGYQIAGSARMAAAVIDLAGPLVIAMYRFELESPLMVFVHWMENPAEPKNVLPMLAHTTLTELLAGVSLGKALFGLRVVDVSGGPAKPWQILVRNTFKAIELIPPFLLMLVPVRDLYRQRAGDILARTIVVGRQPIGPSDEEDGPEE